MQQRVHPHAAVDDQHARVPADDCAHIVAAHAAGGAVGHDEQGYTASDEVESAGDGVGAAKLGEPEDVTVLHGCCVSVRYDFRAISLAAAMLLVHQRNKLHDGVEHAEGSACLQQLLF